METIHLVMSPNERFARHAGAALMSLLCNKTSANPVSVYILSDGLSEVSRSHLQKIANGEGASIEFPEVDGTRFADLKCNPIIPTIAYYRLAIPDIVEADKALYIDCDLIVRRDITDLWLTDIADHHIAAAMDFPRPEIFAQIDLPGLIDPLMYFSSGVMLLNLRKCTEDRIMEEVERFARRNPEKIIYSDQEPLNAILWDKRKPIHPRWNVLSHWFTMALRPRTRVLLIPEIVEAIRDPAIVHFSGPNKPWHYACTTPYTSEYIKYLAMTPWRRIVPERVGLRQVITRHGKLAIRRMVSRQLGYPV